MMPRLLGGLVLAALLIPATASAALPELRISPLRYDKHLDIGQPQTGVIDASNPTGSTVHVVFQVQAFRQVGDKGELEFYDDARIAGAVVPGTPEFDLGPREAIRTSFTIDPAKLGSGGAYGVIFLRTSSATGGTIQTSARVGTLLVLDVGGTGTRTGQLSQMAVPGFIYGAHTLETGYRYANTGRSERSLAFAPALTAAIWRSKPRATTGPFVFPGRTRSATATIPLGSRFGPTPITIADTTGGSDPITRWVFMVTGFWTWLAPLLILLLIALFFTFQKRLTSHR